MGQSLAQYLCWAALLSAVTVVLLICWCEQAHTKRKQEIFVIKLRKQQTHKIHWGKLAAELDYGMQQERKGADDLEEYIKMVQTVEDKS